MARHYYLHQLSSPAQDTEAKDIGSDLWGERAVTAVAAALAVLVVAAIAVLIGMA